MALRYPELKTAYNRYCRDSEALDERYDRDEVEGLTYLVERDHIWSVLLESVYQSTKDVNRRSDIERLTWQGNNLEWIKRLTKLEA